MNLNDEIEYVEVYYDGKCGMCCTFQEWVNKQERANEIRFMPYQSEEAKKSFPELVNYDPAKEMVLRTSEGEVYRAAEAWVWCLWSCRKYQKLAKKLSGPKLLPHTEKLCHLVAANRLKLSKFFFRKKSKEVIEELHNIPAIECEDGSCRLPKNS